MMSSFLRLAAGKQCRTVLLVAAVGSNPVEFDDSKIKQRRSASLVVHTLGPVLFSPLFASFDCPAKKNKHSGWLKALAMLTFSCQSQKPDISGILRPRVLKG